MSNNRKKFYDKYLSDLIKEKNDRIKALEDQLEYYKESEQKLTIILNNYKKAYQKLDSYLKESLIINSKLIKSKNWELIPRKSDVLKDIYYVLRQPLKKLFDKINCKTKFLIIENNDTNIYIDFKDQRHRAKIGSLDINKYVNYENMTEQQKNFAKQTLFSVNNNFISDEAFISLTAENPTLISRNNLQILKKELNKEIIYQNVLSNNQIYGSYLEPDIALQRSIQKLSERKGKDIIDLNQPIKFCISIDGTLRKCDNFVIYSLNSYESGDEIRCPEEYSIVLGVLKSEEKYDSIDKNFEIFHQLINNTINKDKIIVNGIELDFECFICSDYKALLMIVGLNSVAGKQHCVYCKAKKVEFINYDNFFENVINNTNLKRTIKDFDDEKFNNGFVNKPLLRLRKMSHYIIDTLHLRLRIIDKFVSSVLSAVKDKEGIVNIKELVDKLNKTFIDKYCNSSLHINEKSKFYFEYKILTYSLEIKIKTLDIIVDYIIENYFKFHDMYIQFKHIWEVSI